MERENERMRPENAELRGKVETLEAPKTPRNEGPPLELENSRVSRRQLLSKAGVAAAGLVVAGALTQRDIREANAAGPGVFTDAFCDNVSAKGSVNARKGLYAEYTSTAGGTAAADGRNYADGLWGSRP